ncbi:endospore germination permease [Paenibacillus frigoriresistens]|uniref:GerAB/ArcD/ProY family transporter n=1 Tax=Paenibacillus alginolyticus TaxID=59839 RepID=UPI0015636D5A|nr:endospore germination permease [Paenibacillus frigoriresistens]NRF91898.1 endospore germination permease [Paenibacillus frigoriresistens]
MKSFEYGDSEIGYVDIVITISSMIIGVGILFLPRELAKTVQSSDGWVSILLAGLLAIGAAWMLAKVAIHFSKQGYFAYASAAVTKPIALIAIISLTLYFILYSGYEVRAIANISKQYLFERTPVEAISLTFLLVVVYAVSGSRVGIIRLNILFLPIVIAISLIVLSFSMSIFNLDDLKPFMSSDWKSLAKGIKSSAFSLLGFEVILIYITLMNQPKDAPKAVVFGVAIPVVLYTAIYIACVGVFSHFALQQITYPAVELAKEMQIPGAFFERFESIFFTIWTMTVFTTTMMAFDCSIYLLMSVFTKTKKKTWVFILSPVIYLLCMFPRNLADFDELSSYISYVGLVVGILFPILIHVAAKLRGVNSDAS